MSLYAGWVYMGLSLASFLEFALSVIMYFCAFLGISALSLPPSKYYGASPQPAASDKKLQ